MRKIFKQFLTRDFKSPLNLIFVNFYYAVYSSSSLQFSPGHPLYEQNLADLPEREQKIEELAACKHVLHKMRAARTLFPPGHPLYEQNLAENANKK